MVLAADSYWFSNEALRAERQPALLAWCAGPGREVDPRVPPPGVELTRAGDERGEAGRAHGQKNAWMPVCARPRISAWTSCVPS